MSEVAAKVMSLAQEGRPQEALELGQRVLVESEGTEPAELACLWYALAVAHHCADDRTSQVEAAERCLAQARSAGSPGWASNALSMRAMALVRLQQVNAALLDLARAEVELDRCDDDGLACWAHTGLGYCYLELRLYEPAEPHLAAAVELDASPIPLSEARVIDLMNLAELHLRWADELERADPYEAAGADADARRARAHELALVAVDEAERTGADHLPGCRAIEVCSHPRLSAEESLPELRALYDNPGHNEHHGSRAAVGGALARALWRTGRREEALAIGREAAAASVSAGDWQVQASAQWLLVEMESEAGIPGAEPGRDYARLLSRVLWQQRLSTLAGAEAALEVERLRHDTVVARRAAREDPLTGVGNRRAFDDALSEAGRDPRASHQPTTLVVVDLDAFKAVNDRYGHTTGDRVLRAAARAIRHVARAEDLVARLGGDEFVVLARGTDEEGGARLADRVTSAIEGLEVAIPEGSLRLGASVGVRTTGDDLSVEDLLEAADVAMYDAKRIGRSRSA
jgi:diguanylate cyclase (GGDEF)-like protein